MIRHPLKFQIISFVLSCIVFSKGLSQCPISTSGGAVCRTGGVEVLLNTTYGASYTSIRSDGKRGGSGQGNGGSISLMFLANGGSYTIIGKKDDCIEVSNQGIFVPLAPIEEQPIVTSGSLCKDGAVNITLTGSQTFASYDLRKDDIPVQSISGTGSAISFNPITEPGTYKIRGYGSGCNQITAELIFENIIMVGSGNIAGPLPITEGFNTDNITAMPGCWTTQFVSGNNPISFLTNSNNPATVPFEASRYAHWNSGNSGNVAGNETRLVSPPVYTMNYGAIDVEFNWYANNNPSYSIGNYLNEGVQVQYSLNGIDWINAGSFIPRHDGTLTPGTGAWKSKNVRLPYSACRKAKVYVALKFRSENGNNCSVDNFVVKPSENCVFDISSAPSISECIPFEFPPSSENLSSFEGVYPNNSIGFLANGSESIVKFTPTTTGAYYVEGIDQYSATALFIKVASNGCSLYGWYGVSNNNLPGKRALGMLNAGTEYYILADGATTTSLKVCKASVANPRPNSCVDGIPFVGKISSNSSKKEYLLDPQGNLIAELDLSSVTNRINVIKGSYYVNTNATRRDNGNKEYLDRNFTLNTAIQGTVRVKLFFTTAELQRLINEPNDGLADVSSISDLKISKTIQACGPADAGGNPTFITPTQTGTLDGNMCFIEFVDNSLGTYFIHGGEQALNAQCQAPVTTTLSSPLACTANTLNLGSTETNVSYTLFRMSDSAALGTVVGNGGNVSFESVIATSDIYYLKAEKAGCIPAILNQRYYEVDRTPSPQTLLGAGIICEGGDQRSISLTSSQVGVLYTLLRNGSESVGSAEGTGSAINLGIANLPGTYSISARWPYWGFPLPPCTGISFGNVTVGNSINIPAHESFNNSGTAIPLSCWNTQFVVGNSEISLETESPTPFAIPIEGSRMVTWKSYDHTHPQGNESRLVSPPIQTTGIPAVDLEFFWFNNNNSLYSTGNYLNEGVDIQYSLDGINWTSFGAFFPRHDGDIPSGQGKWKKKRVPMPAAFGNKSVVYVAFKFHSEYGDNCNLDAVSLLPSPTCSPVVDLDTTTVTQNKIAFTWNASPGVFGYEYIVTKSAIPPPQGIPTPTNSGAAPDLNSETNYFIHVRKQCSVGVFSSWETIPVTTKTGPVNCDAAEVITVCTPVTVNLAEGEGYWNFAGLYPMNSVGFPTLGKEKIFSFTPTTSGVYYLDVIYGNQYVDYFYKPASAGCGNTDWIGIDDFIGNWRKAIGYLQANTTYLILADNEETTATTQQFKICKATVGNPVTFNNCNGVYWFPGSIPANSPKEEYAIDDQGNLLAALDFSEVNNAVGDVTIYYRVNNQAIRKDSLNKEYLDRDFTITSTAKPQGLIKAKFFFADAELTKLISEPDDGHADINSINDINLSVIEQECSPAAIKLALITGQTGNSGIDDIKYVQANTPILGAFYLHGGNSALNQINGSSTICNATTTSFMMDFQGLAFSYQWQVDKGSGYEDVTNNTVYSGANSKTLFIMYPPPDYNAYKYRCIASGTGGTVIGATQILRIISTWKGTTGSSWEDPSNWSCGTVPDENSNIVIPAGVANMPMVNSNAVIRSLSVQSGANVTITAGFKLEIKGK